MRRNFFGDPYLQPGDDFDLVWLEQFGAEPSDVFARLIEKDEETGLWGCEIADNTADNALYVEGYASKEDLIDWLNELAIAYWD